MIWYNNVALCIQTLPIPNLVFELDVIDKNIVECVGINIIREFWRLVSVGRELIQKRRRWRGGGGGRGGDRRKEVGICQISMLNPPSLWGKHCHVSVKRVNFDTLFGNEILA